MILCSLSSGLWGRGFQHARTVATARTCHPINVFSTRCVCWRIYFLEADRDDHSHAHRSNRLLLLLLRRGSRPAALLLVAQADLLPGELCCGRDRRRHTARRAGTSRYRLPRPNGSPTQPGLRNLLSGRTGRKSSRRGVTCMLRCLRASDWSPYTGCPVRIWTASEYCRAVVTASAMKTPQLRQS